MKKIVFILPSLKGGGAERVALNYLRQLDSKGYKLSLIVLDSSGDLLSLVPASVDLIDIDTLSAKKSALKLVKEISSLKPDVIFTTHSRLSALLFILKPFLPKFKHIARMQNMPSLEKKYSHYGWLKRFFYSRGFKSADAVVAQTEDMKNDALNIFGLKSSKVKVLYNPIDSSFIESSLEGKETPFRSKSICAVASGRLVYQKGFDVLISSLPDVIKSYPDFSLYILGEDIDEGDRLKNMVQRLGLQSVVTFLGFQANPYVYYKFADFFILSSRWEGFPNALLESYYLNKPVVSTCCVPIVLDLVKDGVNGYVCNVDDKYSLASGIKLCIENGFKMDINNKVYSGSSLESLL